MSFNNLTKIFFIIFVSINLSGCMSWSTLPDYYADNSFNHLNTLYVHELFYIGSKNFSWLFTTTDLFYEIDLEKLNRNDIVKYFIMTYNKFYKTNYNAMINVKLSRNIASPFAPARHYFIKGMLLELGK